MSEYEKYVKMIKELTGWDEATIERKIEEVLESTKIKTIGKSFLTKSGAAKYLFWLVGGKEKPNVLTVAQLYEGYSGTLYARVLSKAGPHEITLRDGTPHRVAGLVVGDATGSVRITLWDEKTSLADTLSVGDCVKLSGCMLCNNKLRFTSLEKVPEAEANLPPVEDIPLYPRKYFISTFKFLGKLCEVRCKIAAVKRGRYVFKACPTCGFALRNSYCYKCRTEITSPQKKVCIPVVLDDGTARIESVLWDSTVKKLLGITSDMVEIFEVDYEHAYKVLKEALEGKDIVVRGFMVKEGVEYRFKVYDADFANYRDELRWVKRTS